MTQIGKVLRSGPAFGYTQEFSSGKIYSGEDVLKYWYEMANGGNFSESDWKRALRDELGDWLDDGVQKMLKGHDKWKLESVPVSDIDPHWDGDQAVVDDYASYHDDLNQFPPIVLVNENGRYKTLDGVHRFKAAKKLGHEKIAALIPV